MSQHFLLSAHARTLSVRQVFEMTDKEAFEVFREVRWGKGEETACPSCGSIDRHYFPENLEGFLVRHLEHLPDREGPGVG